ncbi:MAG: Alanine-tRNA ligase [Candidatus Daviesbacteria bacterium GW2011_GWA2_38_24]|uniref:alanine--tRNA ligase n=1 Tax=Candidatus Daviesbacteria bacterium GW2011_GWA2_38_24 TaxID=1618422 RepID=A0A0G0JIA0_9BACT|nr:MAG: Alanine-tRNA ligase [Candidatus Daviesbacteria bacterium GW2011_GWA2_38_24]KKQ78277.1 MAG: Alanine-tRNA ligase [Candidatus Daviesbacteria bacterium GW2011_GWA1_38_7]
MDSKTIREKYLQFFESRGHKRIAPAPLVLENDLTTLFVSAGMQPLVSFLKGKPHPLGKRLVDVQPGIRTGDIEETGDNRHLTFFEMLGNWSLGDYFKNDQLSWLWEFLTKELVLPKEKLHVSVFEGTDNVLKDNVSLQIWKSLGVDDTHIHFYGPKKNWWSRSGTPEQMIPGDIGGPDSEVFYDFGDDLKLHENSLFKDEKCNPNCDCGRFMEIGNSVFIQYQKTEDGTLQELSQKNVDFGGGLERLTAASNNIPDIFETDLFKEIIQTIEEISGKKFSQAENQISIRVIADHIRASTFLIVNGVMPSNKLHGYVLRRLIRRAAVKMYHLGTDLSSLARLSEISKNVVASEVIKTEIQKFGASLDKGLKEIQKIKQIDGKIAFDLYQTYGFPLEITEEILTQKGQKINHQQFISEFEKHKELSRTASAGMFKGGLVSSGEQETKYHTATHLLHQALRSILGDHVIQRGSNITAERLRFDFSHNQKLSEVEIKKVEDLVNEKIKEDLKVWFKEMPLEEAKKTDAIGAFGEKYGDIVKVYFIGDTDVIAIRQLAEKQSPKEDRHANARDDEDIFSKEICGGPHVEHTGILGNFEITKEESTGAGIRRIYATLE